MDETEGVVRMRAYKCDVCGKLYDNITGCVPNIVIREYVHPYGDKIKELCPECQARLEDFVGGKAHAIDKIIDVLEVEEIVREAFNNPEEHVEPRRITMTQNVFDAIMTSVRERFTATPGKQLTYYGLEVKVIPDGDAFVSVGGTMKGVKK